MKDNKKAAYNVPAIDRIALLQGQLLEVRDKMGYTKFQHSRKAGGPSDSDKQELCELETRERNIIDKIADAKRQLEMEEIFDDTISVGYVCNKCSKTIEANETHYHSMALEDLNYDLCGTCYQSISDDEKLLYSDNTVDALTLYAKVARAQSVCEALVKACEQFAEWPCLGYRMVKNGIAENKFTWMRHKELYQIALFLGAGIRQFLYQGQDDRARVFVGVSGINSLDWIISDIAVSMQSMVVVPIHTSLDEDGICHIINTSCVSCVLCSPEMFPKLTASKKNCPSLKLIIQFNSWPYDPSEEGRIHMKALQAFFRVLKNSEEHLSPVKNIAKLKKNLKLDECITTFIQKLVKDSNLEQFLTVVFNQHLTMSHASGIFQYFMPSKDLSVTQSLITCHVNTVLVLSCIYHCYIMGCLPQPVTSGLNDIASVIYTSGSTGFAKGVPFTNRTCLKSTLGFNVDCEVVICKDSLAHASERELVFAMIVQAGRIGIMTNTMLLMEDIRLLSPTTFSTTPRFFNRLYSEYQQVLEVKRLQLEASNPEYDASLLEQKKKEILASFKSMFGGRLKKVSVVTSLVHLQFHLYCSKCACHLESMVLKHQQKLSSLQLACGAATSREVLNFMKELFDESFVSEGYGCTEVGDIATMRKDGVATLYGSVQFQLKSVPALNYYVEDPMTPKMGDKGELLVRTEIMCEGYYNNEAQSASSFADGWFHTGDIVEMVSDKNFKIIDRIKNFFKLSQGEFVSSEKLENIYLSSVFVDQVYITCADTSRYEQKAVFAVVIPRIEYLKDCLIKKGLEVATCDDSTLCTLNEAIKMVHNDLMRIGKEENLRGFEIPQSVLLDSEPFTVDNGCLTSSEKIARITVQKKYQQRVNQCVSKLMQDKETYLASDVHSLIAQTLGLQIDTSSKLSNKSFAQHGGDSLTAMRFTAVVKELFGVDINIDTLLSSDVSLDQLTEMIIGCSEVVTGDKNVLDMMREDMNIELPCFNNNSKVCSANNIFVTGSTGFLGCFLLSNLLEHCTEGKFFCLLRCKQESEGIEKLKNCFEEYNLPVDLLDKRITIVCGDLEKERFGLDQSSFYSLGDSLSSIYHLGAHVNHILGYEALRGPNVLGTLNVIKLSAYHNIPLHHVSSISVIDSVQVSPIPEVACQPTSLPSMSNAGGYVQTKWVSEYLVWCASQQGLPVVIYRPGMISWSINSGRGNKRDWFYRLVQGVMELGSAPDPLEATIALTPVDFLAQSILCMSQCIAEQDAWAKIFHLDNPNRISFRNIFSWIDKFCTSHSQKQLEMMSHKEWWSKLHTEINTSQSSIHEIHHKERLDKLSGLLLFADGVPTDTLCYSLDNSINIGKIKFPLITDEYFIKFVSTEFK